MTRTIGTGNIKHCSKGIVTIYINNKSPPFSLFKGRIKDCNPWGRKREESHRGKGEQNKALASTRASAAYCGQSAEQDPLALPVPQLLHLQNGPNGSDHPGYCGGSMRCYAVPGTCQTSTDVAVTKQRSQSPLALAWGREEDAGRVWLKMRW